MMIGRAWVGVLGVASFASAVTWFGIVDHGRLPSPLLDAPSPPQAAAPAPVTPSAPQAAAASPTATPPAGLPAPQAAPSVETESEQGHASVQAALPAAPQPPAAPAEPTPAAADAKAAPSIPVPTFDIVRVEPSGDAVVAGQGMPGATVELLRNGVPYARSVADVGGQWAIVPPPLAKGAAELSLRVISPDGRAISSDQVVTVRVPESAGEGVVVVLNAPNTPSQVLSEGATVVASAASPSRAATSEMAAASPPEAAQASGASIETVGKKPHDGGRANAQIQAVEADEAGQFFVTGRAEPGADIRIYLNDTPIASVRAAKDGAFGLKVEKGMKPGTYSVRADDVDASSGKVLTRAEVPFVMDSKPKSNTPAVVVADAGPQQDLSSSGVGTSDIPAEAGQQSVAVGAPTKPASSAATAEAPQASVAVVPEIRTVTITRGDSLWQISRKTYGQGTRYTMIYDANTNQIRNPNLIYPGQILVMPEMKAE